MAINPSLSPEECYSAGQKSDKLGHNQKDNRLIIYGGQTRGPQIYGDSKFPNIKIFIRLES